MCCAVQGTPILGVGGRFDSAVCCAVQAAPIVRVAIEPVHPAEMGQLAEGLRLLNRADPFVEVGLSETGATSSATHSVRRQPAAALPARCPQTTPTPTPSPRCRWQVSTCWVLRARCTWRRW
jgi:hypothetical protein